MSKSFELSSAVCGHTVRLDWTEGPTKGQSHEHVFRKNGTVQWRTVQKEADNANSSATKDKKQPEQATYAACDVGDGVVAVSYKSAQDFTLTSILNFSNQRVIGFASGGKDWFPVAGTFEVVK